MKVLGFPESRHTLCHKCYVLCVSVLFFILTKTEAGIESQEKHCSVDTSHDPKACWVDIQIPLAIVRRRRRFKGPVEKLKIQR